MLAWYLFMKYLVTLQIICCVKIKCSKWYANKYEDHLVWFIFHLFENHKEYLTDFHRNQMKIYNQTDQWSFQKRPTRGANEHPQLCAYIHQSFKCIEPACYGAQHDSPIKIEGEGALKDKIIHDYIESKYNIAKIDHDSTIKYLRAINKSDWITPDMMIGDGKVRLQVYQSLTHNKVKLEVQLHLCINQQGFLIQLNWQGSWNCFSMVCIRWYLMPKNSLV